MIPKDGPCLQIGIGGLPDTVLRLLADSGAHDIGIHTEMVTEAIMELHEAGLITGKKKTLLPEKVVWAFSIGSRKLYDWIDHNPALAMYPVEFTNDPYMIAMNKDLISVNACLGVDLQGQVSSESIGPAQYSGTGGQLAFVRGAYYRTTGPAPAGLCEQQVYPGLLLYLHRQQRQAAHQGQTDAPARRNCHGPKGGRFIPGH